MANMGDEISELEVRHKELETELRKAELSIELAKIGLQGTLVGALAGGMVVVMLALIGMYSDRIQITGLDLCIILGIVAAAVTFYGAFVFQQSLAIRGDWERKKVSIQSGQAVRPQGPGHSG
jgi:hypothetical protein